MSGTNVGGEIDTLLALWRRYAEQASDDNGKPYRDGFRCGLKQAQLDVEYTLAQYRSTEPKPPAAAGPEPSAERGCVHADFMRGMVCDECKPAPSAEPMPQGSRDYRLGQLCESLRVLPMDLGVLLSRAGLAIVPAADVVSAEERRVLEGVDGLDTEWLTACQRLRNDSVWPELAAAELARRAAKGKP